MATIKEEIMQKGAERFNQIIELFGTNETEEKLYFKESFPTSDGLPSKEFSGKIAFHNIFVGEYIHTIAENDCILNFASAKHPGGGVTYGSIAQEEDICRNSLLYFSLKKYKESHYDKGVFSEGKLYQNFIIYSKDIPTVMSDLTLGKTNNYITCAAPNLNNAKELLIAKNLRPILFKRLKGIFKVAYENNCKKITLGPWGCGVFANDPQMIADLFEVLIGLYGGHFEQITFLTPDPKMSDIFKQTLKF